MPRHPCGKADQERGKREATKVVPRLRGTRPLNDWGQESPKIEGEAESHSNGRGGDPSRGCGKA